MRPVQATVMRTSGTMIMHVWGTAPLGYETQALTNPEEFRAFLDLHPEVELINIYIYASGIPRRAFPVAKLTDAILRRLFRLMQS